MFEQNPLLGKGCLIETLPHEDEDDRDDVIDPNEQSLEEEARRMMMSWDRENLLKEVEEEKEKSDEKKDYGKYYDGYKSFEDLRTDMTALEGERVWIKVRETNPKGRAIDVRSTVLLDSICFLEYNMDPIESTIHEGRPRILNLAGDDMVAIIPGLILGLLELRQGERADLLIHPAMAYRENGAYPIIPPDAYLYYSLKIHQVWEEGDFNGALRYEREGFLLVPLEEKIQLANEHKNVANQYLSDDKPKEALIRYKAAIDWIEDSKLEDLEKSNESRHLMNILRQNIAITQNKLGMHKSAAKNAKKALAIQPTNIKALFQLAKARIALGDHNRALYVLDRAERLSPNNPAINHLKTQIDIDLQTEKQKRDEIMLKMAKAVV